MNFRRKQGLIFGAIAGAAVAVFFYFSGWGAMSFILIPLGAAMGWAQQAYGPREE